ncbi:hypothetical protein DSO57_1031956 [Entomophthora muscae]|uniref:Uncharacterized protein n=1 Tax=Entomophthora muscae TaxID=34485 RepID=A0ACC2TZ20_9FUNG|nr:hypothetical protein DSO57_1031956 [Entomophthora muscae]
MNSKTQAIVGVLALSLIGAIPTPEAGDLTMDQVSVSDESATQEADGSHARNKQRLGRKSLHGGFGYRIGGSLPHGSRTRGNLDGGRTLYGRLIDGIRRHGQRYTGHHGSSRHGHKQGGDYTTGNGDNGKIEYEEGKYKLGKDENSGHKGELKFGEDNGNEGQNRDHFGDSENSHNGVEHEKQGDGTINFEGKNDELGGEVEFGQFQNGHRSEKDSKQKAGNGDDGTIKYEEEKSNFDKDGNSGHRGKLDIGGKDNGKDGQNQEHGGDKENGRNGEERKEQGDKTIEFDDKNVDRWSEFEFGHFQNGHRNEKDGEFKNGNGGDGKIEYDQGKSEFGKDVNSGHEGKLNLGDKVNNKDDQNQEHVGEKDHGRNGEEHKQQGGKTIDAKGKNGEHQGDIELDQHGHFLNGHQNEKHSDSKKESGGDGKIKYDQGKSEFGKDVNSGHEGKLEIGGKVNEKDSNSKKENSGDGKIEYDQGKFEFSKDVNSGHEGKLKLGGKVNGNDSHNQDHVGEKDHGHDGGEHNKQSDETIEFEGKNGEHRGEREHRRHGLRCRGDERFQHGHGNEKDSNCKEGSGDQEKVEYEEWKPKFGGEGIKKDDQKQIHTGDNEHGHNVEEHIRPGDETVEFEGENGERRGEFGHRPHGHRYQGDAYRNKHGYKNEKNSENKAGHGNADLEKDGNKEHTDEKHAEIGENGHELGDDELERVGDNESESSEEHKSRGKFDYKRQGHRYNGHMQNSHWYEKIGEKELGYFENDKNGNNHNDQDHVRVGEDDQEFEEEESDKDSEKDSDLIEHDVEFEHRRHGHNRHGSRHRFRKNGEQQLENTGDEAGEYDLGDFDKFGKEFQRDGSLDSEYQTDIKYKNPGNYSGDQKYDDIDYENSDYNRHKHNSGNYGSDHGEYNWYKYESHNGNKSGEYEIKVNGNRVPYFQSGSLDFEPSNSTA